MSSSFQNKHKYFNVVAELVFVLLDVAQWLNKSIRTTRKTSRGGENKLK